MNYTGGKRNAARAKAKDVIGRAQKGHFNRQRMQSLLSKGLASKHPSETITTLVSEFDLEHARREQGVPFTPWPEQTLLEMPPAPNASDLTKKGQSTITSKVLGAIDKQEPISLRAIMNRILRVPDLLGLPPAKVEAASTMSPGPSQEGGSETTLEPIPPDQLDAGSISLTGASSPGLPTVPKLSPPPSMQKKKLSDTSTPSWLVRAYLPSPPVTDHPQFLSDMSLQLKTKSDSSVLASSNRSSTLHTNVFNDDGNLQPVERLPMKPASLQSPASTEHHTSYSEPGTNRLKLRRDFSLPLGNGELGPQDVDALQDSDASIDLARELCPTSDISLVHEHLSYHEPAQRLGQLGRQHADDDTQLFPNSSGQTDLTLFVYNPSQLHEPTHVLDHPNPWQAIGDILGLPSHATVIHPIGIIRTEDRRGVGYPGSPLSTSSPIPWTPNPAHALDALPPSSVVEDYPTSPSHEEDPISDDVDYEAMYTLDDRSDSLQEVPPPAKMYTNETFTNEALEHYALSLVQDPVPQPKVSPPRSPVILEFPEFEELETIEYAPPVAMAEVLPTSAMPVPDFPVLMVSRSVTPELVVGRTRDNPTMVPERTVLNEEPKPLTLFSDEEDDF